MRARSGPVPRGGLVYKLSRRNIARFEYRDVSRTLPHLAYVLCYLENILGLFGLCELPRPIFHGGDVRGHALLCPEACLVR